MSKTFEQIITDLRDGTLLTNEELESVVKKIQEITPTLAEMGSYGFPLLVFLNTRLEAAQSMLTWRNNSSVKIERVNGEIEKRRTE